MNHHCTFKTFELEFDLWHNLNTLNEFQIDFPIPKGILAAEKDQGFLKCKFSSNESCFYKQ